MVLRCCAGGLGPFSFWLTAWNPIAWFHIPTMVAFVSPRLLVHLTQINYKITMFLGHWSPNSYWTNRQKNWTSPYVSTMFSWWSQWPPIISPYVSPVLINYKITTFHPFSPSFPRWSPTFVPVQTTEARHTKRLPLLLSSAVEDTPPRRPRIQSSRQRMWFPIKRWLKA